MYFLFFMLTPGKNTASLSFPNTETQSQLQAAVTINNMDTTVFKHRKRQTVLQTTNTKY